MISETERRTREAVSGRLVQQLFQPWGSVGPQNHDWPRQTRGSQGECFGPATVLGPKYIDRGIVGQQFRGGWRGIGRVPAFQNAAQAPMNTSAVQRGREAEVAVVAGVLQNAAVQDSMRNGKSRRVESRCAAKYSPASLPIAY